MMNDRDYNIDQNNRDYDFGHNRAALTSTFVFFDNRSLSSAHLHLLPPSSSAQLDKQRFSCALLQNGEQHRIDSLNTS